MFEDNLIGVFGDQLVRNEKGWPSTNNQNTSGDNKSLLHVGCGQCWHLMRVLQLLKYFAITIFNSLCFI